MEQIPDFSKCDFLNEMAKELGQEFVAQYIAGLGSVAIAEAHTASGVIVSESRPAPEATPQPKPEKTASLTKEAPPLISSMPVDTVLNNATARDDQLFPKTLSEARLSHTYFEHETSTTVTQEVDPVTEVNTENKNERDIPTALQGVEPAYGAVATVPGYSQLTHPLQELHQLKVTYDAATSIPASDQMVSFADVENGVQFEGTETASKHVVEHTDQAVVGVALEETDDGANEHEIEWLIDTLAKQTEIEEYSTLSVDKLSETTVHEAEFLADPVPFSVHIDELIERVVEPAERPAMHELYDEIRRLVAQDIGLMAGAVESEEATDIQSMFLDQIVTDTDQDVLLPLPEILSTAKLEVKVTELLQRFGVDKPQPEQIHEFILKIRQETLAEACHAQSHIDTGMREALLSAQPLYQTVHDRLRPIRQILAKILIAQPVSVLQ